MTKEEVSRVFDPFYCSPYSQNLNPTGIGVGLSICKQICESLGGNIQVFSAPNCGSNFVFTMDVFDCEKESVPESSEELNLDKVYLQ